MRAAEASRRRRSRARGTHEARQAGADRAAIENRESVNAHVNIFEPPRRHLWKRRDAIETEARSRVAACSS